jgi:dolichyl-phosphate beta-glucosyltransferase
MLNTCDLSVVVPAYNEEASITETLTALAAHLALRGADYEILVVADGGDHTRERALAWAAGNARVRVTGTPERRGKGRGVREGIAMSRGRVVGFIDADHKTPVEEIDTVLPWLEEGYDVVIGSRAVSGARIERPQPFHRRIGSAGFGVYMHLMVGLWGVSDTQCGFKFFRGDVARDLFSRQQIDGYMFDVEILSLAEAAGYRIKEVGVRWRDDADSRLDLVSGNWQNLLDIVRIRRNRVREAAALDGAPADEPRQA